MFIGRNEDLQVLNELYASKKFECAVIYGRRRIGKTTLINHFVEGKRNIYFTGTQATANENLQAFSQSIAAAKGAPTEEAAVFKSFDLAFKEVLRMSKKEKLVLIIDEYPYLAEAYPAISSILQQFIDLSFKPDTDLKLILCGSSMSFMQNQVLGIESPLYGRRTANLFIKPFSFYEAKEMLPKFSPEDLFAIYAITGGVPLYLSFMDDQLSLKENLIKNIFSSRGFLFEEPDNLLKQELREPARYKSIIHAIASGSSRLNEIATKTQLISSSVTTYLDKLIELDIVEKKTPILEKPGKKTIYRVKDGLFRFWFRFIPSYLTSIERGYGEEAWEQVSQQLSNFLSLPFESLAIDWLWRQNGRKNLPFFFLEADSWWGTNHKTHKQEEIDIIATDNQSALFCECKYRNSIHINEIVTKLKDRASLFPQLNNYGFYIFTKKPVKATVEGVTFIHLQMIYAD